MTLPDAPLPRYSARPAVIATMTLVAIALCAAVTTITVIAASGDPLWSDRVAALVVGAMLGCVPVVLRGSARSALVSALAGSTGTTLTTVIAVALCRDALALGDDGSRAVDLLGVGIRGALMGTALGLVAAPIVLAGVRARRNHALDGANAMLVRIGAWLLVVSFASTVVLLTGDYALRFHFDYPDARRFDGYARLVSRFDSTWFAATATACAVACLALAAAWDAQRVRWLHRVRSGCEPSWIIDATTSIDGDESLRPLMGTALECDGVIFRRDVVSSGPFRVTRPRTPVAIIPMDARVWRRACRLRATTAMAMAAVGVVQIALIAGAR